MPGNIKLNLKQFSHVKSDDSQTTLQHKDGHLLTLSHSSLPKDMQEQLKALVSSSSPNEKAEAEPAQMMAEGEMVEPNVNAWGETIAPGGAAIPPLPDYRTAPVEAIVPPAGSLEAPAKTAFQATQGPIQGMPTPEVPDLSRGVAMTPEQQGLAAQTPQAPPAAAAPQAGGIMQAGIDNPEAMLAGGFQKQMAGIQQMGAAQAEMGQVQAKQLEEGLKAQAIAQDTYKQQYAALEQERQHHIQDIKDGYVDPDKYWKDHSKIASGIGMILAGFNPTNSPNAAINFLKFQMEQNLMAQRENLGQKQNLLSANMRQFGNIKDAMDMTRLMQNDVLSNQLKMAAAKAQSPMAKAAALQAAGKLEADSAPMFQQFAMRRALMNVGSGGASTDPNQREAALDHQIQMMRVMNPEMAKEMESRRVKGYGISSTGPVSDDARKRLIAKDELDHAARDLFTWAKKNTGNLDPRAIAVGKQKSQYLQSLYREGVLNTVYREGEQPLLDKVVNQDPTSFFNHFSTLPKLQEIIRNNETSRAILAKGVGLTPPPSTAAPGGIDVAGAQAFLKANPNHPQAAQIRATLQKLGVK